MKPEAHGGHMAAILGAVGRDLLAAWRASDEGALAEAMEELALCLPDPPEDYNPQPYLAAQQWATARSGDHQYVLLARSTDPVEHLIVLEHIRRAGAIEHFMGRDYRYIEVDGWRVWAMPSPNATLLNRRMAPGAAEPAQGSLLA